MELENIKPEDIEKRSMEIIEAELGDTPHLSDKEKIIVKRVIHTTADFEYLENMKFSKNAVEAAFECIKNHGVIVTDTNMAKTGINKTALGKLGCDIECFMADEEVAKISRERGITRAVASVEKAADVFSDRDIIYVVGNAPTALIRIAEMIENKDALYLVADDEGAGVIGCCGVRSIVGEGDISNVVVHPDFRKKGQNSPFLSFLTRISLEQTTGNL